MIYQYHQAGFEKSGSSLEPAWDGPTNKSAVSTELYLLGILVYLIPEKYFF